jgi:hypothetical protein
MVPAWDFSHEPEKKSSPCPPCVRIRTASEADDVPFFEPASTGLDLAMTAPDRSNSSDSVPSKGLHVGIDVSRASLEVALIGSEEDASASHTVPNNENGFGQLFNWLERQTDVGLEKTRKQVHVCLEASGNYQRPTAYFLYERGLTVSVVNPLRTSAYAESQLSRSKTDKVNARLLARFCRREKPGPWEPPPSEQKSLKEMTRGLEQLKKERTVPVHHKLEEYLSAYLEEAGLEGQKDEPLFQSLSRSRELTGRRLLPDNALQMVKRRAEEAGFDSDEVTCHTFRGTGITTYLENGGELETAQHIAGHNSATTTKLYDRREQNVEQEEIERVRI